MLKIDQFKEGVKACCPNRTNWITRSCVKLAGNLPNAAQYLTILNILSNAAQYLEN